jgi:hypothetical protein
VPEAVEPLPLLPLLLHAAAASVKVSAAAMAAAGRFMRMRSLFVVPIASADIPG